MDKSNLHQIYEFEAFRLDTSQMMLYRGDEEVMLPPKAVETLLALVERRGEILKKKDLMQAIWANAVVEESNLAKYLHILRKTLGDTKDDKPFIETFRRRGYRFNAEVRVLERLPPENGFAPQTRTINLDAAHCDAPLKENFLKRAEPSERENIYDSGGAKNIRFPTKRFSIGKFAIIAAAALISLVSLSFVWYKSGRFAPSAEARGELTILPLTNGTAPLDATISPDGKYFVYHEQDGSTAHLWLQQTGQSNRLEIIPPLEKMIYGKTFSPDGAFIYFVAEDKPGEPASLYRVPTLGGALSKILDDISSSPSFSPDGKEMVFQRWNKQTGESALIIAAAEGGAERALLAFRREQGLLGIPAWSPDGKLIAYGAGNIRDSTQGVCALFAVNPKTGASTALSPEKWDTCYRMAWTRDGKGLVFIATKFAEAYSTRRDQIYYLSYPSGESRRLTTDGSRYQPHSLGVTDADEIIAVPFNRSSQIFRMNANGEPRTAVQITKGLADGRAGIAPLADGRIGYIARMGDSLNVWLTDADGASQKQLTYEPQIVEELRSSPDGRFFVFSAMRDGRNHLFLIDANGTNLRQLTFGDSYNIDSTVSPDGNWIVYSSVVFNGNNFKPSLQKISSFGGDPVLLADKDCAAPHFSPNGKFISCIYGEKEIIIISAENGAEVKTFEAVKNPRLNIGARWSADGKTLVYIVNQKNVENLWRQPVKGNAAEALTKFTSGEMYNFAFSPDGSVLYVARGFPIRDAVLIKNFR